MRPVELTGSRAERYADPAALGGKARHVNWLIAQKIAVPRTWVIPVGVDLASVSLETIDEQTAYAVRSSATVEDGEIASYAGQFTTVLDVKGSEAIRAALVEVRSSATSAPAAAYQSSIDRNGPIGMAIMIQEFVKPIASGVAFSRNPITGLNEVVIEAVAGRGDLLVSEGHTPDRWVRRGDAWVGRPSRGSIADPVVDEVADVCVQLARAFGVPIDLEWVWDGSRVWWVQARPITGVADIPIYSNRISREVMPGMIKPLVWSINVPMVNGAWVRLFGEALGEHDIQASELARQFAYRSYFNMGTVGRVFELMGMPRDSLEMLLGLPGAAKPAFKPSRTTVKLLPRLAAFGVRLFRFEKELERELPGITAAYQPFADQDLGERSDQELLHSVDELVELGESLAYLNIVTPLLANAHNALLTRVLSRRGVDVADINVTAGLDEALEAVSPNPHLERLRARYHTLSKSVRQRVDDEGWPGLPAEMRSDIEEFLKRFGHFSDSGNDFSVAPWSEQVDLILTMIRAESGNARTHRLSAGTPGPRSLLRRTGRYQLHREVVSYHYTFGYGLFRRYFREMGTRLVGRGMVDAPDDIMMLTHSEVRSLMGGAVADINAREVVAERLAEMDRFRDVAMPEVVYGDNFIPTRRNGFESPMLTGTPTSRGNHRGTIRVVRGLDEFDRVQSGDIIVVPFSDVGWTPLFARAGAVVAESGGVLSHSSIVAREYGIPCVVSVAGAMELPDGAQGVVNGYTGEVAVER